MDAHDHADDADHAGAFMGERRGRLWFACRDDAAVSWRFVELGSVDRARELAAELNALPCEEARRRFEAMLPPAAPPRRRRRQ